MKKALCVGINNYPGTSNDLHGCVNDANDWSSLLGDYGFSVETILDSQATRQNIKNKLNNLINQADDGDIIVFSYSGHGTSVVDTDADEGDGYDEALYVYDGVLLDDEIREIIKDMNSKVSLIVISDSCFSGTVTRVVETGTPRYMPPEQPISGEVITKFLYPESDMVEVLISGCSDNEYSYDANINGRFNGAMTRNAIDVIKANPNATYSEFYTKLRDLLPSRSYPQTPQLEGNEVHKDTRLFEPFVVTGVEPPEPIPEPNPEPNPEPEPNPDNSGGIKWYWWIVIAIIIVVLLYFLVIK